jgi:hypothetical protein
MSYACQFCFGTDGHSEPVETGDLESEDGWEVWFCCHPCRDAGQPCETFHPFTKAETPVGGEGAEP